jgi:integrase/recombinase XerD
MHIHSFQRADGQKRHLLLDDNEIIVNLPTRFAFACAGKSRYSKRTPEEHLKALKYFCEYLLTCDFGSTGTLDELIASVGPAPVEEWLMQQRNRGLSNVTLRYRDSVLKKFMNWLTTQEGGQVRQSMDHPYWDGQLKTTAPHRSELRYLSYQEVSDFILYGLYDESYRCLVHFMFDTGLRVSEIARVVQDDLPNVEAYPASVMYFALTVKGSKGRGGQIKKRYTIISRPMLERIFRLHNNWRVYLRAQAKYPRGMMPVFLNVLGQPITTGAIQKHIQVASKRLIKAGRLSKPVNPHRFRHGTAISILQSEHGREYLENLVVVKEALGHASIRTTEVYTMIPAPIIAQRQQCGSEHEFRERYCEAQFIYEQSFKAQRNHTENRGHGSRTYRHAQRR